MQAPRLRTLRAGIAGTQVFREDALAVSSVRAVQDTARD